jgi:glycosyltransferase involved in cell wall biosynthesis
VLQIVPDFSVAGGQWMTTHLMQHLDRQGFDVAAISLYGRMGTAPEDELAKSGLQAWHLHKAAGFDPSVLIRVDMLIRRFQPDIVHTHLFVLGYALPSLIIRQGLASVHTIHSVAGDRGYRQRLLGPAFHHLVTPVAVCRAVARAARRLYGIDDIVIIPNGIPLIKYSPSLKHRQSWRSRNGFSLQGVIFVCVAGMRSVKNHSLLINAFSTAFPDSNEASLLLVGDGPLKASLIRQADEGKTDRVCFLGERSDIPDILNAADVFVLASSREGNPLCIMEAMAAGKPVIATKVGGIPELVRDGYTGVLFDPGSGGGLVRAMRCLANDREMRKKMGVRARARAQALFAASDMASSYAELYARLLRRE